MTQHVDISQMTPAERLALIDRLWESLEDKDIPVPPAHMEELNRRLDALESGEMEAGEPWDVVRKRLWGE